MKTTLQKLSDLALKVYKDVPMWWVHEPLNRPLTTEENIKECAAEVATWPKWKVDNIRACFSEPKITIPSKK